MPEVVMQRQDNPPRWAASSLQGHIETDNYSLSHQYLLLFSLQNPLTCMFLVGGTQRTRREPRRHRENIQTLHITQFTTALPCCPAFTNTPNTKELLFYNCHILRSHRPAYATHAAEDRASINYNPGPSHCSHNYLMWIGFFLRTKFYAQQRKKTCCNLTDTCLFVTQILLTLLPLAVTGS